MATTETFAKPQITDPKEPQDFSKPITIRWDPMGTPDVLKWWLCVGTIADGVKEGDWNILSGDLGLNRKTIIDVSDWTNLNGINGIRVQLLCTVKDTSFVDTGERTMVLEPVEIKRK